MEAQQHHVRLKSVGGGGGGERKTQGSTAWRMRERTRRKEGGREGGRSEKTKHKH